MHAAVAFHCIIAQEVQFKSLLECTGRCAQVITDKVVEEFASYRRAQPMSCMPKKYASWLAITHWTGGQQTLSMLTVQWINSEQ